MRQRRIYVGVGIFVLGALLLAVMGGIFVYNQYWYGRVETYVMFFKGSLNGLDATSSVTYRGVKIGEVKRIELTATKSGASVAIPVYVEFFIEKSFVQRDNPIRILISNGVVATITAPNLLTGRATIELVEEKAKPPILPLPTFHHHQRFPTKSSAQDIAASDTLKVIRKTFKEISRFVESKEFNETILAIQAMSKSMDKLATSLDQQFPGALTYFNDTLKDVSKAALSARNFTDYLSRHPEALLRGK